MTYTNQPLWDSDAKPHNPTPPASRATPRRARRTESAAERAPHPPTTPRLLDVNDVCQLLRIGRTTLFAEVKAGELARIKINRRTLFDPADVAAFVERKRRSTRAPGEIVGDRTYPQG